MRTVATIEQARLIRAEQAHDRVGLVPTMGYLHEGHLSLVRRARELADRVWVSIFVNPTQFGPGEDLDRYPRDVERDLELLDAEGVDVVFAPDAGAMYPVDPVVEVGFKGLERQLCGTDRPGHFGGVGLVVAKLFNIIQPQIAVFGQKDAQQALLIRRLAADLDFPVEIHVAPTVRELDGLAMSSRNALLSDDDRRAAPTIHRALERGRQAILDGEQSAVAVRRLMQEVLAGEPRLVPQYVECVDQLTLLNPGTITGPVLLAIAARAGDTRLIDNLPVDPKESD
jgi:pantoate--beta-alanine ligase